MSSRVGGECKQKICIGKRFQVYWLLIEATFLGFYPDFEYRLTK